MTSKDSEFAETVMKQNGFFSFSFFLFAKNPRGWI